ncbi:lytic transglycosylase domain-containing protein [Acidiphilium sp. PA]|uniref:lytic transglycosylase domain-containing protein n=1 Tax=Acidiphilium sp. PA TaxID=2871705 RepID=UPI0022434B5D|nr:lytic transglycosylase domain-containing protein [Acidiphilium sp. PA]MCW8308898.1 lytic transglycosylase domain-containing protein [Acidiphilium sp. PA]
MSRQPRAAWQLSPIRAWLVAMALAGCLLASPASSASTTITAQPLPSPDSPSPIARPDPDRQIAACIEAAASTWHISPIVIVILLHVEGGALGAVHPNANGTVDIGPMQINQIWLPTLARHWRLTVPQTYAELENNFCANLVAGTWILHKAIKAADGHLWRGVAYYHSHTRVFESEYLRAVLAEARHLQAEMRAHESRTS